jgi:DNA-binding response OmpR family regulator
MINEKKTILVVDDETDLREAIATALEYEGFVVVKAADGEEAVTQAESVKPDLILLDILMPKRDGIVALKDIRGTEWGKEIPVIVMTVLDDMGKIAEAIEAGADEYLVKTNIALGVLVEKVKSRLGV